MERTKWILGIIILSFSSLMVFAEDMEKENFVSGHILIDGREFEGFENCNCSSKLTGTIDRLIATVKPINVTPVNEWESCLTFAVKSKIMDLPVSSIIVGVCGGSRSCGWGSFLRVVIPKPLKEVKNHLKKKTEIDFTKEERDSGAGVTLRPFLEKSGTHESLLTCDPGTL